MITGRVMGVGKSGNAEASVSYYPIVETDTGKKVKLDGITHETDDFEIGSKYHFLSLYSVQVIVSEVAEKEYQPPTRRSSFD
ncbi:MAG: hypothetical protein FWE36_06605 [Erysipelotrichales bacterium]|nr:hypothetical protein [Erysipelotrichales bacterium]